MSHPLYNYATGNQNSTQGQYGLPNMQAERDPQGACHLGPRSSFSSLGASSAIPDNSERMLPSLMSQSVNYRPEQSRAIMDEDIERSMDMYITRAREEVRVLGKPMHQPIDQDSRFTSTQRDEFRSPGTGMASNPMSSISASLGHRPSNVERGTSSLDWLSNYKRPTADDSKFYSSSVSSNYASSDDGRFNAPSKRQNDMQSIPGLGNYDYPVQDKPAPPPESSRPKYTSESAANILLQFGLEKEDLEQLISYPEDQITPDNLPFILRQIRLQKAKTIKTGVQSKPYPEPHPTRSMSGMDSHSLSSSRGGGMHQKEMSSAVLHKSKVIDYGHTGKYTVGAGSDIGRTSGSRANSGGSGSMSLMDISRQSREPLQKNMTEVKSSALGSSHVQVRTVTSPSSSYSSVLKSVAPPTHDQTKRLQTQPNQTSQTIPSSFSLPKKDTDIRVFKSEASRPVPLKGPEADRQSTLKTQPPGSMLRGVHPSRPGLVLFDSNNTSGAKDQSKTPGQAPRVAEQMKKQQMQTQPVSQMGQTMWPPVFSAAKSVPPAALIPGINDVSRALQRPMFIPSDPRPILIPPALPQAIPALMSFSHMTTPTSNRQPPEKVTVSKGLPAPAMMQDYAAASPRIFPHTCSLCNKECTHMKDWIAHQNTSLHLDSCRLLRKRYPDWDGDIALTPRDAGKDAKPSPSLPAQISQHRHQKTRRGSRSHSRSPSPRRHYGSGGRRERRSSRSRSPHSSRCTRRSRSRSRSPLHNYSSRYRSESRSPERRSSPRRRDKKRSSPRSNDDRRSSPSRSRDKRSSPKRSRERRSSSRESDERRSSSRSSEETRSSPRSSRERQSSTEGSSVQRKKSSSAERLAKKLLETSAVQSLSKQSDLEAVVKTLAPALLAELAKLKSSSSSSTAKKMELTTKASKVKSSLQKSEASSSTKTKSDKSPPPTMVRLQGIYNCLSHSDVVTAVEQFGKTKSVVLFRSSLEAIVCFEKEADAKKLKNVKDFNVKGMAVTVTREKEPVSKEIKKPSQKKPATSSVSTPQTSKVTTTTTSENVPLPGPSLLKGPLPSAAEKATTGKLTSQKVAAQGSVKGLTTVTRAKVLVSKAKNVSTKQITKAVKTGKLPAKGAVKKAALQQKTSSGSKSVADASDSKQISISEKSETNVEESMVVLKETAEVDKSADRTVTEPAKAKELLTEPKVLASEAAMASNTQKPETPADKLAAVGTVADKNVEETVVPSKSTASENQPGVETCKPKESEAKVQEAVVVPKDTAEVVETADMKVFEPKHQEKLDKANDAEDAEPMEVGKTGAEVAEPMEVESCAEGKGNKTTTEEAGPEKSADKPSERQSSAITVEARPTETSVKALPQDQQSTLSEPESTPQGPETKTEVSPMQQQAAGSSAEAAIEDPVKTQTNTAPAKVRSVTTEPRAAAVGQQLQAASMSSSVAVTPVHVGQNLVKHLHPKSIGCLHWNICFSKKFFELGKKQLLITGLPRYYDGCYTEDDVARLLIPFGFQYCDDNIYVIPQTCMAFVQMPTVETVYNILAFSGRNGIFLKGSRLNFHLVNGGITMTPLEFYKRLMKLIKFSVEDTGEKIIFIKNISLSEAKDLRETLRRIRCVKNYLPLLNKAFIQFMFVRDADRLGVWSSLLKQAPGYELHRLKIIHRTSTSQPPKYPESTLPDSEDAVAGAAMPTAEIDIPPGSTSPFWITLRTSPFLFPTICPWFHIPEYMTATGKKSIEKSRRRCSLGPTIMMTGLPEGNYKHEDVAKLVWKYFPKQNLHSLYYNVMVLTLQKRAFVYFADWASCCDFVRDHLANRVSVKGSKLNVHFVLDHMKHESSEEMMYKTLMDWSNAGVPESTSLEERLLCVEISEPSLEVIRMVMAAVASIATFVGFLPLANRICIEMADSSGVTQVLEKYRTFSPDLFKTHPIWSKVQRFENLKSLKQRLHDSSEITINFESDTTEVKVQPAAVKCQTKPPPPPPELSDNRSQPALHASGPVGSIISQPSDTAASDVAKKDVDGEKPGTEIAMDSTDGPEANEHVQKVTREEEPVTTSVSIPDVTSTSAVSSVDTVHAASSPAYSGTVLKSEENSAEVPEINTDIFKALMEAVRQHRLTRGSRSQSEEKADQDDVTDDTISSDTCLFDDQNFNMDDFVTVDEVGDDMEDTSPEPHRSSSSSSGVRLSSGVSSGGKQTSTRSLKDSKSSASSSTPSSKSTKGSSSSNSNSVSPKKSKDSSEPIKSPTKPSSSASVIKTSSSSPLSTEIPSSPGQKTKQSKMQSPSKESTSPGYRTRSSCAAREREKITAVALEGSVESHLEPLGEEAKDTEAAVAKSDHKVSAEGFAAKTVESETKMETSSEMHLTPQGHGVELSQAQSQEIDFTVKEKGKEDFVDKQMEDNDNGENYQILDSLDDQTDEQDSSSETQQTGPGEGQTLHEESCQVLDSVDDEGKVHPEEYNAKEIDGSFQVVDSVTEDQAATSQEDGRLIQADSFAVKQLSEEDANQVLGKSDDAIKYAVTKDKESKQAVCSRGNEDGKKRKQKEEVKGEMLSVEFYKACEDNDQPLQDCDNKDNLKDFESDVTEQETFEILDSIDDETEEDSQKLDTPSDQISKEHGPIAEEEDVYQVIDSLEDEPTTTETESKSDKKGKRTKTGEGTARKDDGSSQSSGPTTTVSKSDEKEKSPKKQDRMGKKYETRMKMDSTAGVSKELTEEMVYKIVDSVEVEPVQDAATTEKSGRRRSARGKKGDKVALNLMEVSEKAVGDEEATYEILDSVEDETAGDEPTVTTRSTRGKRGRTNKEDALNEKTKEETPTKRRHTTARESREQCREKTPKKDEEAPPKESTPTKKSDIAVSEEDSTYEISTMEDEVVKDDQPPTGRKGKRGRPKKEVKTAKKDSLILKSEKMAGEEEATYQILDSVEDEAVDDQLPTGQSESLRKENISKNNDGQTQNSTSLTGSTKNGDDDEEEKEPMYEVVDSLEDDEEELAATEVSDRGRKGTSKINDETPTTEKETKEESLYETVDDLEEVDDPSAAGSGTGSKEVDAKEMVTLDEVGADEAGEERAPESQEWDGEITEGELQTLVTLDEFVEEDEDGKAEQSSQETRPLHQEDESVDSFNPETLVTLDEEGDDEEERPDEERAEKTSRSAKRKLDDETEESMNFVTVDEVGEVEEEEEEEEEEAITTMTRGQAKKRTRQTPVRKSPRGKKVSTKDEREEEEKEPADVLPPSSLDASSSLDKDPSTLSNDGQLEVQKTEVETASQADVDAASAGQELQPENPENQTLEGGVEGGEEEKEGRSRTDIKAGSKQRREPVGPEAKRSRSQSPCVAADVKLPPFKPNNPLGLEFVVPKSGYFCNLCSVFYLNERTAKDVHCSSQRHFDNLQKHYQKLEQKPSRSSTQSSQGSVSE